MEDTKVIDTVKDDVLEQSLRAIFPDDHFNL